MIEEVIWAVSSELLETFLFLFKKKDAYYKLHLMTFVMIFFSVILFIVLRYEIMDGAIFEYCFYISVVCSLILLLILTGRRLIHNQNAESSGVQAPMAEPEDCPTEPDTN